MKIPLLAKIKRLFLSSAVSSFPAIYMPKITPTVRFHVVHAPNGTVIANVSIPEVIIHLHDHSTVQLSTTVFPPPFDMPDIRALRGYMRLNDIKTMGGMLNLTVEAQIEYDSLELVTYDMLPAGAKK